MLRRVILAVGGAALLAVASVVPAFADPWGSVDCDQSPSPACELGVGKGGNGPGHRGDGPARGPGRGGQGGTGNGGADDTGDRVVGGDLVHCSYVRSDYQPPAAGVAPVMYRPPHGGATTVHPAVIGRAVAASVLVRRAVQGAPDADPGGQPGAWYVYRCARDGVVDALYRAPIWIPDGQRGGVPSAAELAEQARSRLLLPSPRIAASPAGMHLVNLPTWLWLDPAGWGERSATAEVPGVSVTATARPTRVVWSMGDGTVVTCPGRGTPFPAAGDPAAASPDCGHTYRGSSAAEPDQTFEVTATVYWTVTWSGAGQGGTFPELTTLASTRFRVAEVQGLNTGPG